MAEAVLQRSRPVGRHNDSLFLLASVGKMGRGGDVAADGENRKITVMNRTKETKRQVEGENRENNMKKRVEKICEKWGKGGRWSQYLWVEIVHPQSQPRCAIVSWLPDWWSAMQLSPLPP